MTRRRSDIESEVEDLALEIMDTYDGLDYVEARAAVRENMPDLYEEFRQAAPEV